MGTIVPILWQGAIPVFADLDPLNGALCPQSVADRITPRTRAVVAIHLWGSACDLDRLMSVCERASVPLVEDCAQAFGTTYRGRPVGTFGRIAAFSLNEFKHISCGDGGLVMTNDDELAVRARKCTDKGYDRAPGVVERNPSFLANNYRMTELQGAVALAQLGKLDSIVARRRSWCGGLLEAIQDLPGVLPPRPPEGSDPSWWFFPFRVDPKTLGASAAEFAKALQAEGLPVGAGYIGKPVYEFPLFSQGSAFERGSHPFGSAEYRHGLCPNAESILESMITMAVNEAYTQQNLEESITAIRRNAFWFASRP
jgi:dTDP-4-amino-4,6-dideoxygalactose transaminase